MAQKIHECIEAQTHARKHTRARILGCRPEYPSPPASPAAGVPSRSITAKGRGNEKINLDHNGSQP